MESDQAKCRCSTLMVQILPRLKSAMGNNDLQTAIASSLSATTFHQLDRGITFNDCKSPGIHRRSGRDCRGAEADVADEAGVEDRVDGPAVIVPALAHALDAGAGGWPRRFARRLRAPLHACAQSPGPQLFENPMPQERGSLTVFKLLVSSPVSMGIS